MMAWGFSKLGGWQIVLGAIYVDQAFFDPGPRRTVEYAPLFREVYFLVFQIGIMIFQPIPRIAHNRLRGPKVTVGSFVPS